MLLIMLILTMIFIRKNKFVASKVTAVLTLVLCFISFLHNIVPTIIMMKSLGAYVYYLLWDAVVFVLLVLLNVCVFRKNINASLKLLWILIVVCVISGWNTWLNYFFYLKSFLNS